MSYEFNGGVGHMECDECEARLYNNGSNLVFGLFGAADRLGWYWTTKEYNPSITRHFCPKCVNDKTCKDFKAWTGSS